MERILTLNNIEFRVTNLRIIINKSLELSPNEINKATALLGIAGGMANLRSLPSEISDHPLTIEFMEDGNHTLNKEDTKFTFTFEEIDNVIKSFQMALATAIDLQKVGPQTIPHSVIDHGEDVFEGRN